MEEPIRILHVLGRLDRGGAETMIMNLYRNIDRLKVQFDFVVHTTDRCSYHEEIEYLGGRIYSIPRYTCKNHFIYKKAWQNFFKQYPMYRIIHGHVRSTASIYLKIANIYGLTTIAHSHSMSSGKGFSAIIKNILQYPIRYTADYMFACSDEAGKWLFGKKIVNSSKYSIIKNAIETKKYEYDIILRNEMRKALHIEDKYVVGNIGRMIPEKNHKFLIEIFYEIQKYHKDSVLLIIGEGDLRPQIEKKILEFGLKSKVIFIGSVPNVNDYLQAMDVFVFPSICEGLGIAAIEAQAAGLPCILSDSIPQEVSITDLVVALSINQGAEFWANEILKYLNNKKRNSMNELIRQAGYDINVTAKKMQNLYKNMYERKLCDLNEKH